MEKHEFDSREARNKKAKPYVWILLVAAVAFIFVMIRFAHTGVSLNMSGLPSKEGRLLGS